MQGHKFTVDVQVLKLGGYDMVLGVDWLTGISPVTFDFLKLTLQFTHKGTNLLL